MGIFKEKSTFAKFREKITNVIVGNPNLDEDFLDELEESLIISDIGIDTHREDHGTAPGTGERPLHYETGGSAEGVGKRYCGSGG